MAHRKKVLPGPAPTQSGCRGGKKKEKEYGMNLQLNQSLPLTILVNALRKRLDRGQKKFSKWKKELVLCQKESGLHF